MNSFADAHPYLTFGIVWMVLGSAGTVAALYLGRRHGLDDARPDARHSAPIDAISPTASSLEKKNATYFGGGLV